MSIPARAGEPRGCEPPEHDSGVYPRACGGTPPGLASGDSYQCLSPRVRGNHHHDHPTIRNHRVYPRACGGTEVVRIDDRIVECLSPRVRGNPKILYGDEPLTGSIPARAGEPFLAHPESSCGWVYPRACGGTAEITPVTPVKWGLSPRVRGNPR